MSANEERLTELEAIAREGFDPSKRAEAWFEIAGLVKESDVDRAQEAVEEGLGLLGDDDDPSTRFEGLMLRGMFAFMSNDPTGFDRALTTADQACALFDDALSDRQRQKVENLRGATYYRLARFDEAIAAHTKSAAAAEGFGDHNLASIARTRVATSLYEGGRGEEAHAILDTVITGAEQRDDWQTIARADRCRAGIFLRSGSFGQSISYYRSAIAYYDLHETVIERASIYHDLASAYSRIDDNEASFAAQQQALSLFREANNLRGVAFALNNIGGIKLDLGEYQEALISLEEARRIKEELKETKGLVVTLRNIGYIQTRLDEYGVAEQTFDEAEKIARSIEDPIGLIDLLLDRAELAIAIDDTQAGTAVLEDASRLADNTGSQYSQAQVLLQQANIAIILQNSDTSFALLDRVTALVGESGMETFCPQIFRLYSKACAQVNRHAEALQHLQKAEELQRELDTRSSAERLQHALVAHDTEQARAARRIAEQERAIAELEAERLVREAEARNKELMATAMFLTQKNEMLQDVAQELQGIVSDDGRGLQPQIEDLRRRVVEASDEQASWQTFEEQFRRVHEGFLEEIARLAPNLTPTEIKVCALAKSGLSIKETAAILAIESRSIEKYRQRARKKLDLPRSTNLVTYLNGVRN